MTPQSFQRKIDRCVSISIDLLNSSDFFVPAEKGSCVQKQMQISISDQKLEHIEKLKSYDYCCPFQLQ
jgi:hypothetical protein